MVKLPVYDTAGERAGEREAPEALFGAEVNQALLHQVVVAHLANQRQGTASTKTRSEVAGSGRKLWRQKGTGRARVGDRRPPSRVGGGVAGGPRPRSYRQRTPERMKAQGLRAALSAKARAEELVLVQPFALAEPKTRALRQVLEALGAEGRVLLVLGEPDPIIWRCGRNIPGLAITDAAQVNAYQVLAARRVILAEDALAGLEARLS